MGSIFGNKLKISIFGESHGDGIGVVIDGLPPGVCINLDYVNSEMARRAPGKSKLSTARKEKDQYHILSGYFEGKTTGAPLCSIIYNEDKKSKDYSILKTKMRPGHSDYTSHVKYQGFNDYRGGGHFSGRITAPLVFAGAVAMQILEDYKNIFIGSRIKKIYNVEDDGNMAIDISRDLLKTLRTMEIPVLSDEKAGMMRDTILNAASEGDSVGGTVETYIINVDAGLGYPFFDSVESSLAHMMFSIPAVKGIEFGTGFGMVDMKGSESNDPYYIDEEGNILTSTNHNGGILGGITNGMPIVFSTIIKPTPSISKIQETVNIEAMENTELQITGRHDPCIVQRAVPVIDCAAALVILDLIMSREGDILWNKN